MELLWPKVRGLLPLDLEEIGYRTKAIRRRRGVRDAEGLLRLCLMYALPKSTLESVARLSREMGLADLKAPALFLRFRDAEDFLAEVLSELLRGVGVKSRVRIVDATSVCGPNPKYTDQRAHVCYDPNLELPVSVEITDRFGGEHSERHPLGEGTLFLGDRAYGYEREVVPLLEAGGRFLVRVEPCSNRFLNEQGRRLSPGELVAELCHGLEPRERIVYLSERSEPLRLVGSLTPEGKPAYLLTNIPPSELPAEQVRELYRTRWQIELFFKRMKTILDLDELRTREGPTARSWILAKFILAVLLVRLEQEVFSPRRAYLQRLEEVSGRTMEHLAIVA